MLLSGLFVVYALIVVIEKFLIVDKAWTKWRVRTRTGDMLNFSLEQNKPSIMYPFMKYPKLRNVLTVYREKSIKTWCHIR